MSESRFMTPARTCLAAVAFVALGAFVASCGQSATPKGSESPKGKSEKAKPPVQFVKPARIIAMPESGVSFTATDPDGGSRTIAQGMRMLTERDGSIERARELFPTGRQVKVLELPERLGSGYLFYATASSNTSIWRATTWTGKLEPVANFDIEVDRIVDGFDRLYVLDQRSLDVIALDANGKPTDIGPLPVSPGFSSMAFADGWFGAVEVPFQGALVTFDAGATWRPLGLGSTYGISLDDQKRLVVSSTQGRFVVDAGGNVRLNNASTDDDVLFVGGGRPSGKTGPSIPIAPSLGPEPPRVGPLGKFPLALALARGITDENKTALVARDGALGRVRLSDGELIDIDEHAFGGGNCSGIPLGDGIGFVCGEERGRTTVQEYEPPLTLRPVMTFDEPRYVASSGNGMLVIRGPCKGKIGPSNTGAYCIRARDGTLQEIRVKGDYGVERIVALDDARIAVIVPPRLGASGTLTLINPDGKAKSTRLKLPKEDASTIALLRKGLWLDGMLQRNKKELSGWVVASGPFVGVRIGFDGNVKVGKVQSDIDRTLMSGQLALVLGRTGAALETVDGGTEWGEVNLPSSVVTGTMGGADSGMERGCSRVGCVFGSWLRVGWRGMDDDKDKKDKKDSEKDEKLRKDKDKKPTVTVKLDEKDPKKNNDDFVVVENPPPSILPSSKGGRWSLTCAATGEFFGPAKPVKPKPATYDGEEGMHGYGGYGYGRYGGGYGYGGAATPVSADEIKGSEWLPFMGAPAPAKKTGDVGFDLGTEMMSIPLRAYAWGARGAAWDRVGNLVIKGYDPLSLKDAVWTTAVGRSPYPDVIAASQAFNRDPNMPAGWMPVLEPSGRAAAILVNARGTMDILLAEEGRGVMQVADATKHGLYQLFGVVKLGSTWYFGSYLSGSAFRLFKAEGGRVVPVQDYPAPSGYRPNTNLNATLVRNVRGDSLGLWIESRKLRGQATTWYVYTLDPQSGEVRDVMEVSPEQLGSVPPACEDSDDGWLLSGDPPVDPSTTFVDSASSLRMRSTQARVVARDHGLCLSALSGEADEGSLPAKMAAGNVTTLVSQSRDKQSFPMVLQEPGKTGRRWGFRCVR
jgi:hypothetical protein